MRISYLAFAVLAIWLLPLSTPAYAGCSDVSCASGGKTITYGSGSYGSGSYGSGSYSSGSYNAQSAATQHRSNSHVSQGLSTRFGATSMAECPPGTTRLSNGSCTLTRRKTSVGYSSGSAASSSSASYGATYRSSYGSTHGSTSSSTYGSTGQVVPFTTSVSKISNFKVAGMGRNEFLSPTTCPTNVYNPGGNKVLGCYSVVKPVQVVRPVPQIRYQQIRVVRPIIYVRYPVYMPMPMPMPVCRTQPTCGGSCGSTTYSRYGNAWSNVGNNCGGW